MNCNISINVMLLNFMNGTVELLRYRRAIYTISTSALFCYNSLVYLRASAYVYGFSWLFCR